MPRLEYIGRNAVLARSFSPMSTRERHRFAESIDTAKKQALVHFFADHEDA
jgi:hypothetical protein